MRTRSANFRYPLGLDAGIGRIGQERDHGEHVEQLIKQVLLTAPGERVNSDLGCGLRNMLFAPNSEVAATLLKVTILRALEKWLSTVIHVDDVKVEARHETLTVTIQYLLMRTSERKYLNLEVEL